MKKDIFKYKEIYVIIINDLSKYRLIILIFI